MGACAATTVASLTGSLFLMAGAVSGGDLRLVATFVVDPDPRNASHAVFEYPAGDQSVVARGEAVADCTLANIGTKSAKLQCAGGAVSLLIEEGAGQDSDPAGDARIEAAAAPVSYQVSLPRDDFQFALGNRQRLVSQVSLEPAVGDGYQYGYRIAWLREGGDFHRLGLRGGDVIVSLNGVPAADPGTFVQAVNGLRGTTSFALGVERDGVRIDYSYLLR